MSNKIVFIDRDGVRRKAFAEALRSEGYNVAEFACGKDAVSHLLSNTVNGIVVDHGNSIEVNNPVPDGKRIVKEIVDVDAFVPLILICDRCDELDHETSSAADMILRRPLTPVQLISGVNTALSETLVQRTQRKSRYIYAFRFAS